MAKILLVDDYEQLSKILKTLLIHEHHDVVVAENGQQAMDYFSAGFYDIVITDIWMPHMDGIELVQKLKNLRPQTKVLAISGAKGGDASVKLREAREAGADATLPKPFGRVELMEQVNQLLA